MISPLAHVDPSAKLGENVTIQPFAFIDKDVEIGDNCVIMPYTAILAGTKLGKNNTVHHNSVLGSEPQSFHREPGESGRLIIGDDNKIRENVVISLSNKVNEATRIGNGNFIMDKVHICHDVTIHDHCVLGINVIVAGGCDLHNCSILSSDVLVQRKVRTGIFSLIQSGCRVQKDVPPYIIIGGNPAGYHGVNSYVMKHVKDVSERILRHISNTYRLVYSGNFSLEDAVIKIQDQIPMSDEIHNIVEFIQKTELGIVRPSSSDEQA